MGYVRKAKDMAREFQNGIDEVAQEVELDDIRKEANRIGQMDITEEINNTVDPLGALKQDLDMSDVQSAIQETADAMNKDETTATTEILPEKADEPDISGIKAKING